MKSTKASKVTQLTGGGIDCLSKIRRFDEGTMRLSKEDAANILDALNEWDETIGAKELADNEIGLDYQRWVELKLRLLDFLEIKKVLQKGRDNERDNEKQGYHHFMARFKDVK
jgi:hypothetical protein